MLNKAYTFLRKNVLLVLILAYSFFTCFYHLDYLPLASWDEAWYAGIAREMVRRGDIMHMFWNGSAFYDHPPMGIWIMATTFKLFGISEFTTRLPSAIAGILSTLLIYLIGLRLFKSKMIGFVAALILNTCVWYIVRVRSGNLDSIFIFFYLATVYFSILSSKNFRWFPIVAIAFGSLVMTKTLVGVSAIILIIYLNFFQFYKVRNALYLALGLGIFYYIVHPWYDMAYDTYSDFELQHFVKTGTRQKTLESYLALKWELPLFYLHMGVRKWFYLWQISVIYMVALSIIKTLKLGMYMSKLKILWKEAKKYAEEMSPIIFVLLWNIVVLYPFLTTDLTQIWHLIPVYPSAALMVAFTFHSLVIFGINILKILSKRFPRIKVLLLPKVYYALYLIAFIGLGIIQFKIFSNEVFPTSKNESDEIKILKAARKYDNIYLDRNYVPIGVYYSGKNVTEIPRESSDEKTILYFFKTDGPKATIVTTNSAVDAFSKLNVPYRVLEKNKSFSIITKK